MSTGQNVNSTKSGQNVNCQLDKMSTHQQKNIRVLKMPSKSRTTNANAAFNFRTIFITGCDQGIGLGLVKAMAKISCVEHIFAGCLMRDGEENIDSELKTLCEFSKSDKGLDGPRIEIVKIDVCDDEMIKFTVENVQKLLLTSSKGDTSTRKIDLLVNNAAILGMENESVGYVHPNRKEFLRHFEVNTMGAVMITAEFLPLLRSKHSVNHQPAVVVNISSSAGSIEGCHPYYSTKDGMLTNFPYGMSKAALNYYTRALSMEVPSSEVIFVAVNPGWIKTEMGGPKAATSVEQCAQWLIERVSELKPSDSGTYFNANGSGPIPF